MTCSSQYTDFRFAQIETLIVKVTHRCNLDCLYCYEHITKKGEDMALDTFKNLVDKVIHNTQMREVLFLFHGGEPTLLKNEWYEQAIVYAKTKAKAVGKRVKFSMQTNLLTLNEHKITLFKRYHIALGISLDDIAMSENSQRGGENRVYENYLKIRKAGIKAGVLTTINQSNYSKFTELCRWLDKTVGIRSFKANVVTPVGRGVNMVSLEATQVFEAQKAIIDYMILTKGRFVEENLKIEILRFFEGRKKVGKTLCHEHRCGAGAKVLGVTPSGDLLPCGRFQWNDSSYFLGNIYASTIDTNTHQTEIQRFHELVPKNWYDCDSCEAKKICGFGCQAFIVRSKSQANIDCLPTKMRYHYFETRREGLLKVYQQIKRNTHQLVRTNLTFRVRQDDGRWKTYYLPTDKKGGNNSNYLYKSVKKLMNLVKGY